MKRLSGPLGVWLSIALSVLAIAGVAWRGGAIAKQVDQQERKIESIETLGGPIVQSHVSMDDQRAKDEEARIQRLERIAEGMDEIRMDIREIKTELKLRK